MFLWYFTNYCAGLYSIRTFVCHFAWMLITLFPWGLVRNPSEKIGNQSGFHKVKILNILDLRQFETGYTKQCQNMIIQAGVNVYVTLKAIFSKRMASLKFRHRQMMVVFHMIVDESSILASNWTFWALDRVHWLDKLWY